MRVPRFFHSPLTTGLAELSADEAHHAADVLRLQAGEPIVLFDGAGRRAEGRIAQVSRGQVTVDLGRVTAAPRQTPPHIVMAAAPPKGQRQQFLVEKCTELGVAALWPLQTGRGVVQGSEALESRWRRWALEACRQCGRDRLPDIRTAAEVAGVLALPKPQAAVFLAHAGAEAVALLEARRRHSTCSEIIVLIGPEGGWSPEELDAAARAGAVLISLGPHILRVETAAVTAAAVLKALG